MFARMKLGLKLGLGFALTIVFLISIALVSYDRLTTLNVNIELMVNDRFPKTGKPCRAAGTPLLPGT